MKNHEPRKARYRTGRPPEWQARYWASVALSLHERHLVFLVDAIFVAANGLNNTTPDADGAFGRQHWNVYTGRIEKMVRRIDKDKSLRIEVPDEYLSAFFEFLKRKRSLRLRLRRSATK